MQQDNAGMTMIKRFATMGLLVLVPMLLLAGCTGTGPKGNAKWKFPWSKKSDVPEPYPNPVRMAVTWAPDTIIQTGRTPTRGFGGRIFFYDEKTHAVPVEGDLMVHAFAEMPDGSVGEVKRYQFTAEQFTKHFSQTDLGASYSIWIPWDAAGGEQMRISLVPTFKASSGKLVQGETALVGLPGKRSKNEAIAKRFDPTEKLLAERAGAQSGLTTTTIPVRKGFQPLAPRNVNSGEMIAGNQNLQSRQSPALATAANTASAMPMRPQAFERQTIESIPMQGMAMQTGMPISSSSLPEAESWSRQPLPEAYTVGFTQTEPTGAQPIATAASPEPIRQAGGSTPSSGFAQPSNLSSGPATSFGDNPGTLQRGAATQSPSLNKIPRPQRLGQRESSATLR
jgi:hypothetical protein